MSYPPETESRSTLDKDNMDQDSAQDNSEGDDENGWGMGEDEDDESKKKQRFEDAKTFLKSSHAALAESKDKQQKFLDEFEKYLKPDQDLNLELSGTHSNLRPRNILFSLMDETSKYSWLIKHLVKNYPTLLYDSEDSYGRKPLQKAISRNYPLFVKTILGSDIENGELEKIIALTDTVLENCIHVAVCSDLELSLILRLIDRASKDSLSAENRDGSTPLHHAVDFNKKISGRLDITKALIKNDDKAFDVEVKKNSVYEQLVETYKIALAKLPKPNAANKRPKIAPARTSNASKENPRLESSSQHEESLNQKIDGSLPEKDKKQEKKTEDDQAYEKEYLQKMQRRNQADNSQVNSSKIREPMNTSKLNGLVRTPTTTTRTSSTDKNKTPFSPVAQSQPKSIKGSKSGSQAAGRRRVSDHYLQSMIEARSKEYEAIAHELKLHYLRSVFQENSNRSHDSAIKFLYGDNPNDMNICFEFPPIGQEVTENIIFEDFKRSYGKFSFDKVLQSVHFGEIQLDVPNVSRHRLEGMHKPGNGRKDMIQFFNWLKAEKEITHIVMVTVDDMKDPPHSDEALETSLKGLDIEILNWRKWDLDPKTIQDACDKSNLREVHLYWRGNNAILRAWSEPDGLVKLERLETIYVYASKVLLESQENVERNYKEFRDRMGVIGGSRAIRVKDLIYNATDSNATSQRHGMHPIYSKNVGQTQIDPHQWLTVMDSFVEAICKMNTPQKVSSGEQAKLEQGQHYLKDSKLPEALREDVKVALIDDGADFMHKAIAGKLEGGRSFGIGKGVQAYHGSTTGHGTSMAYMIGRVCPHVKIYVCKLDVIRGGNGTATSFTAESAANAVEFAVKRGFDIISISWTVQKEDNGKHIDRLSSAIKKATEKNILVFCSAPDIGVATSNKLSAYYPFGDSANKTRLFRIGAAKADGSAYPWLGNVEFVDFILPGDNVKLLPDDSIKKEDSIPKTGSSVATALAAGFAALIIHCVRMAAIYHWYKNDSDNSDIIDEVSLKSIKNIDAMKKAFEKIAPHSTSFDRRLEVETFFKNKAEALKKNSDNWDVIVMAARALVPENLNKMKKS